MCRAEVAGSTMPDRHALFVIRDAVSGRALILFGASTEPAQAHRLTTIAGTCNQPPCMAQRRVAEAYLQHFSRAHVTCDVPG
ncbi:MAG: hypothetical protein L0H70_09015 [Xanthomonadales bacterium]|nr:hypothetical protein [Xanthomonadales bacterium]